MSKKELYLSEYYPKSELVVDRVVVEKPKFPMIDFHAHLGTMLLGEDYAKKYDMEAEVEKRKAYGVKGIVNLEPAWGDDLYRFLE